MGTSARYMTGLLLAVFLAVAPALRAAEGGERPEAERDERLVELQRRLAELQDRFEVWRRETAERLERWWAEHRDAIRRRSQFEDAEPLDHALQLAFELVPGNGAPLTVVISTRRFEVETNFERAGEGMHIAIEGNIEPLDDSGKVYRLRFKAEFDMGSEEEREHQSCRGFGSTVVTEGRPACLLALGDTSLVVKVSRVEVDGEQDDQD